LVRREGRVEFEAAVREAGYGEKLGVLLKRQWR